MSKWEHVMLSKELCFNSEVLNFVLLYVIKEDSSK
jgi:hypothetical protein